MEIEKNSLNRLNHSEVDGALSVEKTSHYAETNANAEVLGGKDKATLSEKALLLANARGKLDEVDEVRSDKVDELRQKILSGNYQVPHEQIIRKLLSQVRME